MEEGQRQSIGAVIRTMREAMGMTRPELAEASAPDPYDRVSVEMIAKVEQGRKAPSAKTLRKLAAALGIEPLELSSRAATWEAAAAAGASMNVLRAALTAGSFGRAAVPFGAAAAAAPVSFPIVAAAVASGLAVQEFRERDRLTRLLRAQKAALDARLAEVVERGSAEELEQVIAGLEKVLPPGPDQ